MADDLSPDLTATEAQCPWCSAPLPVPDAVACPSCGATLISETEPQVPGVTAIDPEAIMRGARGAAPQRRSRLLSWISGEVEEEEPTVPGTPESLAPPPVEVRREMLRMEIAAELSDLQAEAESILADEEIEASEAGIVRAPAAAAPAEPTPVAVDAAGPDEPGEPEAGRPD